MRWWIFDYDGKLSSHTDYMVGVDSGQKGGMSCGEVDPGRMTW